MMPHIIEKNAGATISDAKVTNRKVSVAIGL